MQESLAASPRGTLMRVAKGHAMFGSSSRRPNSTRDVDDLCDRTSSGLQLMTRRAPRPQAVLPARRGHVGTTHSPA